MFEQANSVDEWIVLARRHADAAYHLRSATMNAVAWVSIGTAIECVFKAAIMQQERLNQFPSRDARPDLYVHDLASLAGVLGASFPVEHEMAPLWSVIVRWRVGHRYAKNEMSDTVTDELLGAAFSPEGLVPWICRNYLRGFETLEANTWTR